MRQELRKFRYECDRGACLDFSKRCRATTEVEATHTVNADQGAAARGWRENAGFWYCADHASTPYPGLGLYGVENVP